MIAGHAAVERASAWLGIGGREASHDRPPVVWHPDRCSPAVVQPTICAAGNRRADAGERYRPRKIGFVSATIVVGIAGSDCTRIDTLLAEIAVRVPVLCTHTTTV